MEMLIQSSYQKKLPINLKFLNNVFFQYHKVKDYKHYGPTLHNGEYSRMPCCSRNNSQWIVRCLNLEGSSEYKLSTELQNMLITYFGNDNQGESVLNKMIFNILRCINTNCMIPV